MRSYLPDEDAWRYDPAPVAPGWRRVALLAPLLAIALVSGSAFWYLHTRDEDERGYLDHPDVVASVRVACALMTSTVEGLDVRGPARRQAAVIADQNKAVRTMIRTVGTLDRRTREADQPLDAWLQDWERLLRARDRYARQVGTGFDADFRVPRTDGDRPLVERMDRAAGDACPVPEVLVDPYSADDQEV